MAKGVNGKDYCMVYDICNLRAMIKFLGDLNSDDVYQNGITKTEKSHVGAILWRWADRLNEIISGDKNNDTVYANDQVSFNYKNYKGELSIRKVKPMGVYFGSNEWHPKPQWLLRAFDVDKQAERSFAMQDISNWSTNAATKN